MKAFMEAAERGDAAGLEALLADDVVFTSPVAHRPYPGKAMTAAILREETFKSVESIAAMLTDLKS